MISNYYVKGLGTCQAKPQDRLLLAFISVCIDLYRCPNSKRNVCAPMFASVLEERRTLRGACNFSN